MKRTARSAAALVGVAALTLAACGDREESSSSSDDPSPSDSASSSTPARFAGLGIPGLVRRLLPRASGPTAVGITKQVMQLPPSPRPSRSRRTTAHSPR